jgi:hypothetical protein
MTTFDQDVFFFKKMKGRVHKLNYIDKAFHNDIYILTNSILRRSFRADNDHGPATM